MHKIRYIGRDYEFADLDSLWFSLVNDYRDKSVAVHVQTDTGLIRPVFVDIDCNGAVYESYGSHRAISTPAQCF